MSFADWVSNGWLVAHKSSKQEIGNLFWDRGGAMHCSHLKYHGSLSGQIHSLGA